MSRPLTVPPDRRLRCPRQHDLRLLLQHHRHDARPAILYRLLQPRHPLQRHAADRRHQWPLPSGRPRRLLVLCEVCRCSWSKARHLAHGHCGADWRRSSSWQREHRHVSRLSLRHWSRDRCVMPLYLFFTSLILTSQAPSSSSSPSTSPKSRLLASAVSSSASTAS